MSREQGAVALYELDMLVAGTENHLESFSQAVQGCMQGLADTAEQAEHNAKLIYHAVHLLPPATVYRIGYDGDLEYRLCPHDDASALLARRATIQGSHQSYYAIGTDGKSDLYVAASAKIDKGTVTWLEEARKKSAEKHPRGSYNFRHAPKYVPSAGHHEPRMIWRAKRSRKTPDVLELKQLLATIRPDEAVTLSEAKQDNDGKHRITSPAWQGHGKFEWVYEHGISTAELARYDVLGRLATLTTVFKVSTPYKKLVKRWIDAMPAQRPGSEADPIVTGVLELRLGQQAPSVLRK